MEDYTPHSFKDGNVLYAENLNDMDSQIEALTDAFNDLSSQITDISDGNNTSY